MLHSHQPISHPYGYLITQKNPQFGFIRISKNASTYIHSSPDLSLNRWMLIENFQKEIYAIFRNPYERILSGSIEFLKRYNPPNPNGEYYENRNIPINSLLNNCLNNLDIKNLYNFANEFLELIEESFFDAHIDLQINFLKDTKGNLVKNINFYLFDEIQALVDYLLNNYKIEKNNFNFFKNFSFRKKLYKKSITKFKSGPLYNYQILHQITEENLVIKLFKEELKKNFEKDSIKKKIARIYYEDISFYNQLVTKKNEN